MANIVIDTNGTLENTKLIVDGKEITKDEKVSSISLYAYSSFVSKYSGETIKGGCGVSFEIVKDDGTFERKDYGNCDTKYKNGIGQSAENTDSVTQLIGRVPSDSVENYVNLIIDHCEKNNIKHPSKEDMMARSEQSLKDKINDLGIELKG